MSKKIQNSLKIYKIVIKMIPIRNILLTKLI